MRYYKSVDLHERVDALKKRRRSVRPQEVHALLIDAGFRRRYGKGDHWVYTHADLSYPLTVDPRNPLLPVYVSRVIRAVEEVLNEDDD
jgi:predicted RNA binding protein YcfA (HicA-like mRNA interferase family)